MDALSALSTILRASCWIRAWWSGPANDSVGTEGSSLLEQRCAEIHVTNLQRFAPCQARSGEATISAAPWYRVGGRFRQSMAASGSSGGLPSRVGDDLRRPPVPPADVAEELLERSVRHVGTAADGSPAGGSGSGGSHSDDRRLRLNAYGQIMLERARRSISEINAATERIAALRDPDSGTVRMAFLHSLASWLCSRSPAQISECSAAGPVHPQSGRGVRDGGVPGGRAR